MKSCEQQARDILERMEIPDAQSFPASRVIELANLIAEVNRLKDEVKCSGCGVSLAMTGGKCDSCFYFPKDGE